jgi:hypothetical protein
LNQWLKLLERYEGGDDKSDVAYWYGERSLTGLLGAAGWLLPDGWSLEEFSTKRKPKSGNGTGRGDLWIGQGTSEATVEAKIYWVDQKKRTAVRYLKDKLDEAAEQLQAVSKKNRVGTPVSVCYVVPEYDVPNGHERGVETITELEAWALAQDNPLATAKHFAASGVKTESKGSEYPGVLLVARREKWANTE